MKGWWWSTVRRACSTPRPCSTSRHTWQDWLRVGNGPKPCGFGGRWWWYPSFESPILGSCGGFLVWPPVERCEQQRGGFQLPWLNMEWGRLRPGIGTMREAEQLRALDPACGPHFCCRACFVSYAECNGLQGGGGSQTCLAFEGDECSAEDAALMLTPNSLWSGRIGFLMCSQVARTSRQVGFGCQGYPRRRRGRSVSAGDPADHLSAVQPGVAGWHCATGGAPDLHAHHEAERAQMWSVLQQTLAAREQVLLPRRRAAAIGVLARLVLMRLESKAWLIEYHKIVRDNGTRALACGWSACDTTTRCNIHLRMSVTRRCAATSRRVRGQAACGTRSFTTKEASGDPWRQAQDEVLGAPRLERVCGRTSAVFVHRSAAQRMWGEAAIAIEFQLWSGDACGHWA